jgi:endonuclease/exonuclease/phosphatase family metal-dependent hydrolase
MRIEPIRVMSFNIHHGKGTDGIIQLNRIFEVIHRVKPDIVGLNEVDRIFHSRSDYMDQPSLLSAQLGMNYAFAPALNTPFPQENIENGGYGNAILSRFPIQSFRSIRLSGGGDAREPRVLLQGKINRDGAEITVFVTHLSLHPWHHRLQTSEILSITSECEEPHLIMGDWNMRPGSRPWRLITQNYQDIWINNGQGRGATFPSKRPLLRLDYIFVSPHFEVQHSEVSRFLPMASDHLPVWCDLNSRHET